MMKMSDIKVVDCAIVKRKVVTFYCRDCFFFGKDFCKKYQIEVSENDGCSNYEMKRGYDYGE